MKRSIQKAAAGILALIMLAGTLIGCGKDAGQETTKSMDPQTTAAAADGAPAGEENPWMVGDPENPIELTVFLNHTWYPTEEFEGIIPEEITKRTGIKLKPVRATDDTQLGVLISSGELPDLVFTSKMLDTLSDPDVCYAYNELIDQFNVDWDIDNAHIVNARAFSADDNYYFIHSHAASNEDWAKTRAVPMVATVLYRHDMLEELGNPEVKNLEDLDNLFAAVKEKWPDVVPLNFSVDTWYLNPFKTWNNCSLQYFDVNENKECEIVAKTEPFYNYLKYCNSMYQNGYINADNFSWGAQERTASFCSGKVFATVGSTQYGPGYYAAIADTAPEADVREMLPLSDYKLNESDIGWAGTFITKNNKYPEESIRFMQFLFSDEGKKLSQWGREGIDYTLNDMGLPEFSEEWTKSVENDTQKSIYNPWFYFGGSKILEAEARCAVEPENFQISNDAIRESYQNEPWYIYATPKSRDGDYKVIYDKMVDLVKTGQAKVILSADDAEFEKNYNEFISQLDAIDVDSLAEFMTPRLQEALTLFGVE